MGAWLPGLTNDGNNAVSGGNQLAGTLTMNNAGTNWTGDLLFNRGTVTLSSAASPSFTTNDVTFNSFGRFNLQGVNSQTLTNSGTLTYATGAVGEIGVDNTATVSAPFTVNFSGTVALGAGAGMRLFLADGPNAPANFSGGVTLGGNASISVGGTTAGGVATFSGVIGDGGSGFGLAVMTTLVPGARPTAP